MKFKLFYCFILLLLPLGAKEVSPEEIRIYLTTTSPLEPLYLGQLHCSDGSVSNSYLKDLYSVLAFDLNYNGATRVLPVAADLEEALRKESSAAFNRNFWKNWSTAYVVKGEIQNQSLVLSFFSAHTGALKQFPPVALTASLPTDRKNLHRLSDAIFKALFGKEGVASSRLLYSVKQRKGEAWVSEIWCCDWDGANSRQITYENGLCVTPVFIPPSARHANDRFLYVSYKLGQPKIFLASLSQGKGEKLIDLRGNQLLPAISSQRTKIAFICDAASRTDLFMQEFHPETGEVGKPIQLFSYPRSTQASPTFSPDGSQIAFVSDKDGAPRIYLIPAASQSKRAAPLLITKKNGENSCPSWSPDGKKIAYSAKTKGTRQIWIYDFDKQEEWQLTDGSGNKENPSWAPDSRHLVFNSTDGHISELYLVNLSQPDVIKISKGPGIKHYPSWGQ